MATSKLTIYNGALRLLGQRKLASLAEESPARRYLDDIWDDGLVDYCLSQGQWAFATRSSILDASESIVPDFGYQYAFEMPDDFKGLVVLCYDEYFQSPIIKYSLEAGIIYCDVDEIYIRYISNDANYGGDYSLWSDSFNDFVKTKLALDACEQLTKSSTKLKELKDELKEMRKIAKNNDLQNKPPVIPATGSWINRRMGSLRNRDHATSL